MLTMRARQLRNLEYAPLENCQFVEIYFRQSPVADYDIEAMKQTSSGAHQVVFHLRDLPEVQNLTWAKNKILFVNAGHWKDEKKAKYFCWQWLKALSAETPKKVFFNFYVKYEEKETIKQVTIETSKQGFTSYDRKIYDNLAFGDFFQGFNRKAPDFWRE